MRQLIIPFFGYLNSSSSFWRLIVSWYCRCRCILSTSLQLKSWGVCSIRERSGLQSQFQGNPVARLTPLQWKIPIIWPYRQKTTFEWKASTRKFWNNLPRLVCWTMTMKLQKIRPMVSRPQIFSKFAKLKLFRQSRKPNNSDRFLS